MNFVIREDSDRPSRTHITHTHQFTVFADHCRTLKAIAASIAGVRGLLLCAGAWTRGAAGPIPFHAFRRACAFYSWYLLRPTWWAPENPRTLPHARAPSACGKLRGSLRLQGVRAHRYRGLGGPPQSDCRSTAGEDQQGLRVCGLERAAFDAVMPCRLWLLGWRDADPVAVQRAARSHATASGSPIREELGR